MPVTVQCICGQRYSAKESLAGKSLACPRCKAVITVPEPALVASGGSLDDLLAPEDWQAIQQAPAVEMHKACPQCGARMPEKAVLCTACGYHQTLRSTIETEAETKATGAGEKLLQAITQKQANRRRSIVVMMVATAVGAIVVGGVLCASLSFAGLALWIAVLAGFAVSSLIGLIGFAILLGEYNSRQDGSTGWLFGPSTGGGGLGSYESRYGGCGTGCSSCSSCSGGGCGGGGCGGGGCGGCGGGGGE